MKKSILNTLKSIEGQLSKIQHIVNLLEKKSTLSSKELRNWLAETEEMLQQNRLPESSVFSAKRGVLSTYYPKNNQQRKKELLHFCSGILSQAQEDLWTVYKRLSDVVESAKTSIKQLLGVIYQVKQFKYDASVNFTLFIQEIWKFCTQHEQLRGLTSQVLSVIGLTDVLIILAEEIEIENL